MNVSQALKKKAKLINDIKEKWVIIATSNSIIVGNPRKYDLHAVWEELNSLMGELVELKTKIHLANGSVYHKIFRLSELKTTLQFMKSLNVNEGFSDTSRYGGDKCEFEVVIDVVEKGEIIKHINLEIDKLQDELDLHNAVTQID